METKSKTIIIHKLAPLAPDADPHRIRSNLYGLWKEPGLVGVWIEEGAGDTDGFFERQLCLTDKGAYLEFRELLKAHLAFLAADQKRLAGLCRRPGGDSSAQSVRTGRRGLIAALIDIRRAGKAWSAERAREAAEAERLDGAA